MLLLVDANVLIDFARTDRAVLARVARHVGAVYVPRDALAEVDPLDEAACAELGLLVVDGTIEQLTEAGAGRDRLSFEDRVCLILARDNGWTCVSNDGRLRRECEAAGVHVMWGLQLMLELVAAAAMTADDAIAVAEAIGRVNPRMRAEVIDEFKRLARGG